MSALDRIREKFKVAIPGTSTASKSPSAGFAGSSERYSNSTATPSASSAGQSHTHIESSDPAMAAPLSPAQEAARQEVLAQLAANPGVKRAFCNRFENGVLIVTLAIRDIGTCELLIPANRFNPGKLEDYAVLLDCLGGGIRG